MFLYRTLKNGLPKTKKYDTIYARGVIMQKQKIMIDLDDTIVEGGYLEVLNEYLGTNYTYEDTSDYFVESLLPEEKLDDYLEYFYNNINVYDYAKVKPKALEVIEKLSEKYEIYICSAYLDKRVPTKSGVVTNTKHMWLIQNLPFLDPKNFIFTSRKDLIDCEIKIDDKVGNLKGLGTTKLLMDSYHNQKFTEEELQKLGIKRVFNWQEIQNILL